MDFPVFVVLPGSGVGLRFGTPLPKQYTDIKNKSLFLYTVQAFHRYIVYWAYIEYYTEVVTQFIKR